MSVWATLTCDHQLLWDDPDEDANGSFFCAGCGGWFRVKSFNEDGGTE